MKRFFKCLIVMVLVLMPIITRADFSTKCGDKITCTYNEQNKTLTLSGTGRTYDLTYDGKINGDAAFNWNSKDIKKVIVEEGITELKYHFFYGNTMEEIQLPSTLGTIEGGVFDECFNLKELKIPYRVTFLSIFDTGNYDLKRIELSDLTFWSFIGNYYASYSQLYNLEEIVVNSKADYEASSGITLPALLSEYAYNPEQYNEELNKFINKNKKISKIIFKGTTTIPNIKVELKDKRTLRFYIPEGTEILSEDLGDVEVIRYSGEIPVKSHKLIVNNGFGSFDYNVGDTVYVYSNLVEGKQFSKWVINKGNIEINTKQEKLEFIMPDEDVELTAEYIDAYSNGEDITPPVVTNVRIVNSEVNKPGVVHLKVDIIEADSGVNNISLNFSNYEKGKSINAYYYVDDYNYENKKLLFTGTHDIQMTVKSADLMGDYVLQSISVSDKNGNQSWYSANGQYGNIANSQYLFNTFNTNNGVKPTLKVSKVTVNDDENVSVDTNISNPALIDRINSLEDDGAIKIRMNNDNDSIITKNIFDAIKGTNKKIIVHRDEYKWIFFGKDIVNDTKDINSTIKISKVPGNQFGFSDEIVLLEFKPNGLLPGKSTIKIKSDYLYSLKGITGDLYLYYYDNGNLSEEATNLEATFDGTDKWIAFDVTHNSKFYITGKKIYSPGTLKVSSVGKTNVKMSWSKAGGSGYQVYRSTDGKTFKKVSTISKNKTITFNNTKLKAGTTYYYKVRAYKKSGKKKIYGQFSNVITVTTPPGTPAKPGIKATKYNQITLTLKGVKTAKYYEVQRSTKKNKGFSIIGTTETLTYEDNSVLTGKTYYYRVRACNEEKKCSGWSKIVNKKTSLVKPSISVNSPDIGKLELNINAVDGAEGYEIQMSTKSAKKGFKKVTNTTELLYSLEEQKSGKKLFYKVRAYRTVNGKKAYSGWSTVQKIVIK